VAVSTPHELVHPLWPPEPSSAQTMPTELHLPTSLPYPIKVITVDADVNTDVRRGSRLLSYSFLRASSDPKRPAETRFGTWDCAVEGTVDAWWIRKGDVVTLKRAKEKPVLAVTEPCTHDMQVNGMCALCGKDMTKYVLESGPVESIAQLIPSSDYLGFDDTQRAHIQMTHTANGPTVSLKEAQRLERETADRLLKTRRLSLIVDLDQTIVHATVDPTVGEWITEGEAWEARQAKRAERHQRKINQEGDANGDDDESESSSSSDEEQDNEVNPNWDALKDVRKFRLAPESFMSHTRGHAKGKGKARVEDEGCLYYIKPR
jgi:RNA polymerase II subunit A-like phosphatase